MNKAYYIHSSYSDGFLSRDQLLDKAYKNSVNELLL